MKSKTVAFGFWKAWISKGTATGCTVPSEIRKEQWQAVWCLLKSERYSDTFEKAPDLKTHYAKLSRTLRLWKTVNAGNRTRRPGEGPQPLRPNKIISQILSPEAVENTTLPSHHHTSRSHDGYLTPYRRPSHNLLSFSGCPWNSSLP